MTIDLTEKYFKKDPKLGFYTVGDRIHYIKSQALIEATQTNQFPHWNFNNDIFGMLDWATEPADDIRELYRQRAQQLRDRYDWIRVEASGGGDSTTAIFSFLLNGIHLDEVVFRYPSKGEKDVTDNPHDTRPENTLSEFRFAAKPLLQWIEKNYPKTKITIHDYSEFILDCDFDDTWVLKGKDYFQIAHVFKHDPIGMNEHRKLADTGREICVLYGIDKPKMCIKDNKWYLYFLDLQANHSNPVTEGYTNISIEYFYWTADLPAIPQKQAHIIRNWFMRHENQHLQYLLRWPNSSISNRTTYEQIVKPLIYPDYDPQTFQTAKPTNSFYNEMDHWFAVNFSESDAYKKQLAGQQLLVDMIDSKYFNYELGRPVGFVGFLSPFYCIGDATPAKERMIKVKIQDRFE